MAGNNVARCLAYGRHSTVQQGLTQEAQEERCKEYWQRCLEPKGVVWGGFFYDKAVSAGRVPFAERPEGRLLFHSAEPADHVVMTRLDRCFRSVLDGVSVMEQLERRGVFFHSLDYNIDTSSPIGRYVRNILLAGAELERDLTVERTREVFGYLRRNGLPYTKLPPMGWKIVTVSTRKEFRVNREERDFIEMLAQASASGASIGDIAMYCWTNRNTLKMTRNFCAWTAVKWALQARELHYPKVCGAKRIAKMMADRKRTGKIQPAL